MEDFKVIMRRIGEDPKTGFRLSADSKNGATSRGLETIREQAPGGARHPGYVTVRLCATETRRQQQGHYNIDKMLETQRSSQQDPDDKLPIVELRPFTKKEWRPSKSVPGGHGLERTTSSLSQHSAPGNYFDYENHGYPNPGKQVTTPRGTDCVPCPKAFTVAPGDRASAHPRHRDPGVSAEYGTGYAPRHEREKSTMGEIRSGTSMSAHYSCHKLALTDDDHQQQQRMRINGRKIDQLPPKVSSMYCDPWDYYKLTKSGDMAQTSAEIINNHAYMGATCTKSLPDENIYDAFDRSKTLPSIKVRRAPLRRRATQPPSRGLSTKPAYRLGVTNSLDLLSHYGTPIGVEHQLSNDMKITIDQLRRNKNHSAIVGGAFKIVPKYYDFSPTYGEKRIKSGIQRNAKSRQSATPNHGGESGRGEREKGEEQRELGHYNKGWMSRATTYIDSGIESMNGNRSPSKSVHGAGRMRGQPGENIEIPSMKMYNSNSLRDLRKAESLEKLPPPVDEGAERWQEEEERNKMAGIVEAPADVKSSQSNKTEEDTSGYAEGPGDAPTGNEVDKDDGVQPEVGDKPSDGTDSTSSEISSMSAGQTATILAQSESELVTSGDVSQGDGQTKPHPESKNELSVTIPTDSTENIGSEPPSTAKNSETPPAEQTEDNTSEQEKPDDKED